MSLISIIGAVNHGKTTLLKSLGIRVNPEVKMTSRFYCYSWFEHYLIDTPGHDCFLRDREIAVSMSDLHVLIVEIGQRVNDTILTILNNTERPFVTLITKCDLIGNDMYREEAEEVVRSIRSIRSNYESAATSIGLRPFYYLPFELDILQGDMRDVSYKAHHPYAWLLNFCSCRGVGNGLEVLLGDRNTTLPRSLYTIDGQRLDIDKCKIKLTKKDLSCSPSSDSSVFLKSSRAFQYDLIGTEMYLTKPSEGAPLSDTYVTSTGKYNLAITAESWTNVLTLYERISNVISASRLDIGMMYMGIGLVPRSISENYKHYNCKLLGYGYGARFTNIYDLDEEILAYIWRLIVLESETYGTLRVAKHFHSISFRDQKRSIFGAKLIKGRVCKGDALIVDGQVHEILSLRIRAEDVQEGVMNDYVGVVLESSVLPPIKANILVVERQVYQEICRRYLLVKRQLK